MTYFLNPFETLFLLKMFVVTIWKRKSSYFDRIHSTICRTCLTKTLRFSKMQSFEKENIIAYLLEQD